MRLEAIDCAMPGMTYSSKNRYNTRLADAEAQGAQMMSEQSTQLHPGPNYIGMISGFDCKNIGHLTVRVTWLVISINNCFSQTQNT